MLRSLVAFGAALMLGSMAQAADPRPIAPSGAPVKAPYAAHLPSPWKYVPPLHYEARPFHDYRPFRTYRPYSYLHRPGLRAPAPRSGADPQK